MSPVDAQNWSGYGFLNYRATQHSGSETLYGSYYGAGDVVGVLLDMDHGTISFFKDGEDFNSGRTMAINMGVAYHSLRRNHRSLQPMLYPCFGLKSSGDQLSIRRCRWASKSGVNAQTLLGNIIDAKHIISQWSTSLTSTSFLDTQLSPSLKFLSSAKAHKAYVHWRSRQHERKPVKSRPGIDVFLDVRTEAIVEAVPAVAELFPYIKVGIRMDTQYGPARIIGSRPQELWFLLENEDSGAWYWSEEHFLDLISMQMVSFHDAEESKTNPCCLIRSSSADERGLPVLTADDLEACFANNIINSSGKYWSVKDDETLKRAIDTYTEKHDTDPLRVSASELEEHCRQHNILTNWPCEIVQGRYVALCILNRAIQIALPFVDFGRPQGGLMYTGHDVIISKVFPVMAFEPFTNSSGANFSALKHLVFTRVKHQLWKLAVEETTEVTSLPPDEYERPDEMPEVKLNRLEATAAKELKESLQFNERLEKSLFGQLLTRIGEWDVKSLRKSYVQVGDAGQRRAFFVKFVGEGVDDHGGPYRAAFESAIGDEPQNLLDMLVPCPNAEQNIGLNRDQMILNLDFMNNPTKLSLYHWLGKLIGIASRHRMLCSLSLPMLVWRPLAGEALSPADLAATDLHVMRSLQSIVDGEVESEDALDMLCQLLSSTGSGLSPIEARRLTTGRMLHHRQKSASQCDGDEAQPLDKDRFNRLAALVEQRLTVAQLPGIQQLCAGIGSILPLELCSMFTCAELEVLFCGEPEVDISLLQKVTVYDGVSASDT